MKRIVIVLNLVLIIAISSCLSKTDNPAERYQKHIKSLQEFCDAYTEAWGDLTASTMEIYIYKNDNNLAADEIINRAKNRSEKAKDRMLWLYERITRARSFIPDSKISSLSDLELSVINRADDIIHDPRH